MKIGLMSFVANISQDYFNGFAHVAGLKDGIAECRQGVGFSSDVDHMGRPKKYIYNVFYVPVEDLRVLLREELDQMAR